MPDWLIGFLIAITATLIGFGLAMLWDHHKYKRDTERRDKAVIGAVVIDVSYNLKLIEANIDILNKELELIEEEKTVVQPLNPFLSGFWDLVKINLPKKLADNKILARISEASIQATQLNEEIRSREVYRLHNLTLTTFIRRLKLYDEDLLKKTESYKEILECLDKMLSYVSDNEA